MIVGYGLLFDSLLDYHLLIISSTSHCKFTELALPTLHSSPNVLSPSPTQSRRTTKPATYLAYPFPDDTPLKSPGQSIRVGFSRVHPHILREKDPISTDAIKLLGEITVRIRNTVGSILRVGEGLRRRSISFFQKTLRFRLELQHKELAAQLSKLSSTHTTITKFQKSSQSRTKRLESIKKNQFDLESRANSLLRKLLTINHPQTSEAEEKWFKELSRVNSKLHGQRGFLVETKTRIAEGKKYIELAEKRSGSDDQSQEDTGGKRKLDGRVMEAIEEAYGPLFQRVGG